MLEEWRDIPGCDGRYQASNLGNVRSPKKQLKPSRRPSGHSVVWVLNRGLTYVHQLVMLAFVGERPPGHVTLHLNHCPGDNRLKNLRYGTVSENLKMDFAAGSRDFKNGLAPAVKLSNDEICFIRSVACPSNELAEIYKMSPRHIRAVRSGESRNYVVGSYPTDFYSKGNPIMAKAPLTPTEIKTQKQSLVALLKAQKEALKPLQVAASTAAKEHAAAKKAADKAVAVAQKSAAVATAKLQKAEEAASKGAEKINAKLAALTPASVTV